MFKKCPTCSREFKVNVDGKIRQHWCQPEIGNSKSVKFATGGTLTLRLEANWMLFRDAERALLVAIIDALDQYELHLPNENAHASDSGSDSVCARTSTDDGNNLDHLGRTWERALEVSSLSPRSSSQVCREEPQSIDSIDPQGGESESA